MAENALIGPTQAVMIAYERTSVPDRIREAIAELRDSGSAVRIVDVLELHRGSDGVIQRRRPADLGPRRRG